jgi:hypothetical protein
MSEPQSGPPPRSEPPLASALLGCWAVLATVLGIIMLLPGLCSLVLAPNLISTGFKFNGKFDISRLIMWVICLLIGVLGVALIRSAGRRS